MQRTINREHVTEERKGRRDELEEIEAEERINSGVDAT
jgi:hypothetical protein